jgi:hypothetical protein
MLKVWTRIRYRLIRLLVGKMPVVMNVTVDKGIWITGFEFIVSGNTITTGDDNMPAISITANDSDH